MMLHEKVKPVSFMDKARMMRECRSSLNMTKEDSIKWKDSLVTVLGVKDRRRLVQCFGVHLAVASLQPDLWAKVSSASEKLTISEKLMRGFIRLEDSDKFIYLDTLMTKGAAAFRQNVKALIDAGFVRGKKNEIKKRKAEETSHEENETVAPTEGTGHVLGDLPLAQQGQTNWRQRYEELMEKYKQLKEDNELLANKLKEKTDNEERECH